MSDIKVMRLGDCEKGDVIQFLSDRGYDRKIKYNTSISLKEYNTLKNSHTKGIVISKTAGKVKTLEFDSIGRNRFDRLLILSNIRKSLLVCKLNYNLEIDPILIQ